MSIKVMLIDDSALVRKVMKRTLALAGVEEASVIEAEHGKEALEKLSTEWVDIIFLDINMPVMNGVSFMESVSKDPLYSKIPVVVVSTEGSDERKEQLKSLGVKHYLRKPVTPESVITTFKTLLGV